MLNIYFSEKLHLSHTAVLTYVLTSPTILYKLLLGVLDHAWLQSIALGITVPSIKTVYFVCAFLGFHQGGGVWPTTN